MDQARGKRWEAPLVLLVSSLLVLSLLVLSLLVS
jgi:hypothetical protein